jgi:hypothetical protein
LGHSGTSHPLLQRIFCHAAADTGSCQRLVFFSAGFSKFICQRSIQEVAHFLFECDVCFCRIGVHGSLSNLLGLAEFTKKI